MRIISDFHDFYDCGMKYGQDDGLIYYRKEKIVEENWKLDNPWKRNWGFTVTNFAVGFAGKHHIGLLLSIIDRGISSFCYNIEAVDCFVNSYFKEAHRNYYWNTGRKFSRKHFYINYITNPRYYYEDLFAGVPQKIFMNTGEETPKENFFEKYNAPIYVISDPFGKFRKAINCELKKYQFFRVIDPITAYQELSMYMANQASPEKPIPKMDDKDMRDIKGFDKYSFKKDKQ